MSNDYRFSFGPWNIHGGADPFGPVVRDELTYAKKLTFYKQLGFDGIQFHDDDAVPELNELSPQQIANKAKDSDIGRVLLAPKYLIKDLFGRYDRVLPEFDKFPEHANMGVKS